MEEDHSADSREQLSIGGRYRTAHRGHSCSDFRSFGMERANQTKPRFLEMMMMRLQCTYDFVGSHSFQLSSTNHGGAALDDGQNPTPITSVSGPVVWIQLDSSKKKKKIRSIRYSVLTLVQLQEIRYVMVEREQ